MHLFHHTRRARDQYSVRYIVIGTLVSHHKVKIGVVLHAVSPLLLIWEHPKEVKAS